MIQHNVIQGSEQWAELRHRFLTASEAPVIMGCHPNMTRDALLEAKATSNPKEYSRFTEEKIFAKGHETEAAARPLVEAMLGEELYPVTGTTDQYLASFDGLTLMNEIGFEHKQWNADLALLVKAGKPPAYIFWQLEHQLLVCPELEKIMLVVSNGTEQQFVSMEYTAVPGRREQLIAAWDQFQKDLAEFRPVTRTVEAVGVRPDTLPALFVDVGGALTTQSNLDEFRAGAERLIGSIKTELVTDQDFADAEAAIKWLDETEKNIDLVIQQALSKTGPLDQLVRTLKDVQQNLARVTRLKLNKQVEAQKLNRRNQIVADAEREFVAFLDGVNGEFAGVRVTISTVRPDFYAAIKGKRSFDMMVSACNDAIAKGKIGVNEIAGKVRRNLRLLADNADHGFLFPNTQQLVFMEYDHLALTIKSKISEYKAEQERTETARIQGHKNVIAGIEAAGELDDSIPYSALVLTRQRVDKIDTSRMQEFTIKADQAKAATLAKIDAQLAALREQEQARERQQRPATQQPAAALVPARSPASTAATFEESPLTHDLDDVGLHEPVGVTTLNLTTAVRRPASGRPSDAEITAVLCNHFQVSELVVRSWLEEIVMNYPIERARA